MHPVLARFLDPENAATTLRKAQSGAPLDEQEQWLALAGQQFAEDRRALLEPNRGHRASPQVQESIVRLAAHAAARAVAQDERLGPAVARVREAMLKEGSTEPQVWQMVAGVLLEEAFGYDDAGESFDVSFVLETLACVPALVRLDSDRVRALAEGFAQKTSANNTQSTLRRSATQLLFGAAWSDGPEAINVEHVEVASEQLSQQYSASEAGQVLRDLLRYLHEAELVGPLRLSRLEAGLARASSAAWLH